MSSPSCMEAAMFVPVEIEAWKALEGERTTLVLLAAEEGPWCQLFLGAERCSWVKQQLGAPLRLSVREE